MKKSLAAIFAVALLAIALLFFFKERTGGHPDPTAFLPEDALVYFHQKDLSRLLKDFQGSPLGKAFRGMNLIQTARDLNLPDQDISLLEKVNNEGIPFINGPVFKEIFSNDCAIALIPADNVGTRKPIENIEQALVLISRPEHGARLVDLLTTGFGAVLGQATETYDRYTIHHFQPSKQLKLSVVAVQDLVFIGLNDRLIKACLDRYARKERSLADNENFRKISATFTSPVSFGYVSLDSLKTQIRSLDKSANPANKALFDAELRKWAGVHAAGYGVWKDKNKISDKGILLLNREKCDPIFRNIYQTTSEKNSSLAFVPEHVLGYYWTNTMDFLGYWKLYLSDAAIDRKMTEVRRDVKQRLGLDIEDILGMLDRQCGFMIQKGEGKMVLPLPDFSLFVRIKQRARFEKFFQNFLKNSPLNITQQDYKGVGITSMAAPSQGGLAHLHTMLHNDYFVVTTGTPMMKKIIDVMAGGSGLKDDMGFKKVSTGLLDENNTVGYIRIGDLMRTVKVLLNWGRGFVAVRDQEHARRLGIVMNSVVNPLLDGLTMYSDFGMRGRIGLDRITVESTTLIDGK